LYIISISPFYLLLYSRRKNIGVFTGGFYFIGGFIGVSAFVVLCAVAFLAVTFGAVFFGLAMICSFTNLFE